MNIDYLNGVTAVTINGEFNLERTLLSGQCFRWRKNDDGSFSGTAFSHELTLWQKDNTLYFNAQPEDVKKIWIPYFALDIDYEAIKADILRCEPLLAQAADCAAGIRILRQEPWEALCSFVISQNSNIPKIKRSVEILCERFGAPLAGGGYSFPPAQVIAALQPEQLDVLRSGYRAPYIINAAQAVCNGTVNINTLRIMPIDDARKVLMQVKGIGKKVADCSLLYGFERMDCFPVDRWIARAMEKYFPDGSLITSHPYAGIAQLYIFYMMISDKAAS